jgi:hypothetical protein
MTTSSDLLGSVLRSQGVPTIAALFCLAMFFGLVASLVRSLRRWAL